jgi:vacuolar-type H+-ATPase subunit I/STV1
MAVITTRLFNISFSHQDLMKVLVKIDTLSGTIFPTDAKKIASNVKGVSVMDETNPYTSMVDEISQLYTVLGLEKPVVTCQTMDGDITALHSLVEKIYTEVNEIQDVKEKLISEREDNLEVIRGINEMQDANINVDEINECSFLNYRFGRLQKEQVDKIQYYQEYPFLFKKLQQEGDYIWIVYMALTRNIGEIDNIFNALSFEEIALPYFVHGTFNEAYQELKEESNAMQRYIEQMNTRIIKVKEKYQDTLKEAFTQVMILKQLYDHAKCVVDFSHKEAIFAFSALSLEEMKTVLQGIESISLLELPATMYKERGIEGPIMLHNHPFFQPFEGFSGVKKGVTFDAATLIGSSIIIVSAICLGDIGVGVLLFVLGLLGNKERNGLRMLNRLGMGVFLGGLLRGSIGYGYSLYTPVVSLPSGISALGLWLVICIGIIIIIKVIQKLTKKQE